MDFFELLNKINTEYPQAIPFLQQPGVMAVFSQAVNESWTPDRVQAGLQNTEWWKNTPEQQRQWQALQITDPATASQKAELAKRTIADMEAQTGVKLDSAGGLGSPAFQFFVNAVTLGWDANEIKYRMLASVNGEASGGELGTLAAGVKNLANQYGVVLSDKATMDWARQLGEGAITQDSVRGYLIEQAKSMFPGLADALDRGITVEQYADPYKQVAVQELGVNPQDITWTDPRWMKALNQIDPKTGARTSMSLDQWVSTVRTDDSYGYDKTSKAQQSASQLAGLLQQKMGAAA